ncbi:MAG: hypothetical protein OEU32_18240, partial [Acidimicrobiia bacterium]|nr:hypothetical protein [Acidimicrobiia bacterium]
MDQVVADAPVSASRWSGWSAFAASESAAPERRATDAVLLALAAGLLGWTVWRADPASQLDVRFGDAFQGIPSFFDPLWQVSVDLVMVWCVVLVGGALLTRRFRLFLQLILAAVVALGAASLVGRLALSDWPDLPETLWDDDGPPIYPAVRLALVTAMATTASPVLTRPFRFLSRSLLAVAAIGVIALEITLPGGAIGGFAIGLAVAALIHLVFGSPGWRPNTELVTLALERVGMHVEWDGPATFSGGVARMPAIDDEGRRLSVQVHGRDAWQGQFFSSLFRFFAYRDSGPTFTTGRLKQVEHEAFVTLFAERSGASVSGVVTVVETDLGDAVLVVERHGESLHESSAEPPAGLAEDLWSDLQDLHRASIAHGRIDHHAVVVDSTGKCSLTNFSAASVGAEPDHLEADNAQALVLTATISDGHGAIASAASTVGPEVLGQAVPYLQRPVMSPTLRDAIKANEIDLDELRAQAAEAGGVEEPELVKLRRVTWGSVIQVVLMLVAAWVLVSAISEVGLSTLWDSLSTAQWAWVVAAMVLSQLARIPSGLATIGATVRTVRLWPAVALDFAI